MRKITDSQYFSEVTKHVGNTTSKLNENYWIYVQSAQVYSTEDKRFIEKVDRFERELQ